MHKQLKEALAEAGAILIRQRKHYIYRLPNGRQLTVARTPSDRRDLHNTLAKLRRLKATP